MSDQFQVGFWGLFRVAPSPSGPVATFPDTIAITDTAAVDGGFTVSGAVTVRPARMAAQRTYAPELQLRADGGAPVGVRVEADGRWSARLTHQPTRIEVTSPFGGVAHWSKPDTRVAQARVAAHISALPRFTVQSKRRVGTAR